jgi:putative nucleotidyltransferase with HDIG domain
MAAPGHLASLFSHKLDRTAFTAYFLGAVVPLVALAVVVDRFALPEIHDRLATLGLIGALFSIAVLSLASFLTLRISTRRSLAVMDRDNERLASLLRVSGQLSRAEHGGTAALAAAASALELTDARAAWVVVPGEAGQPAHPLESAGADAAKLFEALREPLAELANLVLAEGRPAALGPAEVASAEGRAALAAAAAPLPGEAAMLGALVVARAEPARPFDAGEQDALATLAGLAAVALRNAELQDAQRNFFTHVTDILVHALDAHLNYHTGHGARVAQYANRIGRELGLDDHRLQRLHFAALLHDIGMLKLDRNQQMNPRTCARHTVLGFRMLDRIRLWKEIAPVVHHHHERWDGSGYPEGLAGEAIPLEARVIALADAFDTITSETSYRAPRSLEDAAREIEAGAATHFDPAIVSVFRRLVDGGAFEVERRP